MKKIIAKILRRWADKLAPSKEIQLPALSVKVGDLLLMRAGHQYPKGAQTIDFARVLACTLQNRPTLGRRTLEAKNHTVYNQRQRPLCEHHRGVHLCQTPRKPRQL